MIGNYSAWRQDCLRPIEEGLDRERQLEYWGGGGGAKAIIGRVIVIASVGNRD